MPKNTQSDGIAVARHKSFYYKAGVMSNRWWSDPLILGKTVRAYGIYSLQQVDIQHIQTKLDFIGLNVYSPFGENWNGTNEEVPSEKKNSLGWVNEGRCLYWTIRFFHERYGLPVMVTENGLCDNDEIVANNLVRDEKRANYIREYIGNVKRAVDEGIPVLGYQYWSLMDNFEWAEGYAPRFGLIHVDFDTQKRTPKDSAFSYKKIIETNGASL